MATYDPEFYDAPKFSAEPYQAPPRQRGCFFYGCVIASVLAVLFLVALAAAAFFTYRFANRIVQEYTATAPAELPKLEMPPEERKNVRERFDAFRKAVREGEADGGELELTADDLNALVEETEDLRGVVHFQIDDDKLKAQVSFPLERMGLGFLKGRFLNGEAELKASLSDGVLIVTLDSIEVKGRRPPEDWIHQLREKNLAEDAYKNPRNAEMIRRLESLRIKDGKIIIKARRKPASEAPDAASEPDSSPSPDDGTKPEPTPPASPRPTPTQPNAPSPPSTTPEAAADAPRITLIES